MIRILIDLKSDTDQCSKKIQKVNSTQNETKETNIEQLTK